MKYAVIQLAVLLGVTGALVAGGHGWVAGHWGAVGLRSLWAAAGICLAGAVVGAVPVAVVAARKPEYLGHASLAGTAIRLVLTGVAAAAYQVVADVHLASFLTCLLVIYLVLLAAETTLAVLLVRRMMRAAAEHRP